MKLVAPHRAAKLELDALNTRIERATRTSEARLRGGGCLRAASAASDQHGQREAHVRNKLNAVHGPPTLARARCLQQWDLLQRPLWNVQEPFPESTGAVVDRDHDAALDRDGWFLVTSADG